MRVLDVESREVRTVDLRGGHLGFFALGAQRWCTGRVAFGPAPGYVPCPEQRPVDSGSQCEECESKDPFRFVHTVHRGGFVSKDLEPHVMQPHWLYIATFANAVHKVGTAADTRKWGRLAEQGAVCAEYVARAENGKVVRVLEDRVTERLQIRQAVRSSAKAAALALPVDTARLGAATASLATAVREDLAPVSEDSGYRVVTEAWEVAGFRDLASGNRLAYPGDLTSGPHGFSVNACIGQTAIVEITTSTTGRDADDETSYVVDLHALKGRRIKFGDYTSDLPAVQTALF